MKHQFAIQIKETGGILRYFDTLTEALIQLAKWEIEDEILEAYVPDFYEIAELTLDGTYTPVES
jgi:hypothetical protein